MKLFMEDSSKKTMPTARQVNTFAVEVGLPGFAALGAALYRGYDMGTPAVYVEIVLFVLIRVILDLAFYEQAVAAHERVHGPARALLAKAVFNVSLMLAIAGLSAALLSV